MTLDSMPPILLWDCGHPSDPACPERFALALSQGARALQRSLSASRILR